MEFADNKRDVFAEPSGATGHVPLGKSHLAWTDFAAGVSTTKEVRHRASGGCSANPSARSMIAYEDVKTDLVLDADDPTHIGGGVHDSDDHRDGRGIDRR